MVVPESPVIDQPWPGLPDTERRVLLELLLQGGQSRVRVAERLGLSRTSLTRITRGLLDTGLLVEGDLHASGSRGRPAEALHLRADAAYFLGVKLTGHTMYAVVTDLRAMVVEERSYPLRSRDVADVVSLIADFVSGVEQAPIVGIGVAVAGDVAETPEGAILRRSDFLGWDGVALTALVHAATLLPTTVVNDVHALTGAHHWFGSSERRDSLVVYGVGAGIGAGIVIGGELYLGSNGRAGRVSHTRIGGRGRVCTNGHTDCVHSFVSIPAIEENAGVEPGGYGQVLMRARGGDGSALAAFQSAARALGAAIAESVNGFDPESIVVMGEGVDMMELAPEGLRSALAEFLERGDPHAVVIERPSFHFGLYARGAAVASMRQLLG